MNSNWSDELINMTIGVCRDLLADTSGGIPPVPVKNWEDRFGLLTSEACLGKGLCITDWQTGRRVRYQEVQNLLNAGWVID